MKKTESSLRYCLFDTDFGAAGIVWSDYGICGVQLPQADQGGTRDTLTSLFPTAQQTGMPDEIKMLTRRIERHLRGEIQDFSNVRMASEDLQPFSIQLKTQLLKNENALPAKCGV